MCAAATCALFYYLRAVHDVAPLWDALTTVLSLAAQFLLTRKFIENWYFWIMADLIYVPLYIHRHLLFTGGLYVVFLGLCVTGLLAWRQGIMCRVTQSASVAAGARWDA
jgi:nicotinamide mononucleotide transporter